MDVCFNAVFGARTFCSAVTYFCVHFLSTWLGLIVLLSNLLVAEFTLDAADFTYSEFTCFDQNFGSVILGEMQKIWAM